MPSWNPAILDCRELKAFSPSELVVRTLLRLLYVVQSAIAVQLITVLLYGRINPVPVAGGPAAPS